MDELYILGGFILFGPLIETDCILFEVNKNPYQI